jgi:membrane protease YdiL (CAAX protease family)
MSARRTIWSYVGVVLGLSYGWQLVIYLTGGVESRLFPVMMLFPGAVAVVFLIVRKESFRAVGWGLRRWWYIAPVLVVPLVVTLGVGSLLLSLGWASWSDAHFVFRGGAVEIRGVPMVLGTEEQSVLFFTLNLILSLLLQSILGSIVTIGEELGWRGYAQEKIVRLFGMNRGLILLGLVWGYWHLPIILMGYNFPNHPILGAVVLMPTSTIFMGIFLGWLYLRSGSIWMPTVAHAAMNLSAVLLLSEITMQRPELIRQLVFIAAWGMVAACCLLSLNRSAPVPGSGRSVGQV